jgi:cellulose biosynthesis protein BcsQ
VVAVVNGKGGVGKTTLAHNLAVHARALDVERPVLVIGLDGSPALDEMFAAEATPPTETAYTALQRGTFENAIRPGLHGVHYVPSSPRMADSAPVGLGRFVLQTALRRTAFPGLVLIDTHSDLGVWTQNAITASDLSLVPVCDGPSLLEARRVFHLLDDWGEPRSRARLVLSMLDLRIKFQAELCGDLLGLLTATARRFQLPLFRTFITRSPSVQALTSNPEGRHDPILHAAARTEVGARMTELTRELLAALARSGETPLEDADLRSLAAAAESPAEPVVRLRLRNPDAETALPFDVGEPLCVRDFPFYVGRQDASVLNDLAIDDVRPWQVSRRHAHLVRRDGRIGVVDLGSQRGTWVDGRQLGGPTADPGPAWFESPGGVLILGDRKRSPYVFDVEVSEPFVVSPKRADSALSPLQKAALAALAH